MSDWIEHDGKEMPVDGETRVSVKFADGWTDEDHRSHPRASFWGDTWTGNDSDGQLITHYKVVSK